MAKNILVVDDAKEDLNIMKGLLKKEGYNVVLAENGAKALDSLEDYNFDLILIDIKMPILSGYELMSIIKSRLDSNVSIVYVSVLPKKQVELDEVDGFIQKPFSPVSFLSEVNKLIGEKDE
jgi:CheY-like chemotaxis protein